MTNLLVQIKSVIVALKPHCVEVGILCDMMFLFKEIKTELLDMLKCTF